MAHWRAKAAAAIAEVLQAHPTMTDPAVRPELLKLISDAYPFGERAMLPYKVWLDEVARTRDQLARAYGPTSERLCLTCGARPGRSCVVERWIDHVLIEMPLPVGSEYHAARQGKPERSGPLFDSVNSGG